MATDPYASIAHDPYASIAAPAVKPEGDSPLKKIGDMIEGGARSIGAARTAAARDPVGAAANILGAPEGAVAGAMMAPTADYKPGQVWQSIGHGIVAGATDPKERDRYNAAMGKMLVPDAARPKGDSIPARVGRGAEDFALQTMVDPVTHGGAAAASGLLKGGRAVGGAALKGVKPLGNYVNDVKSAVNDPALKPAMGKVAHVVGKLTSPLRGGVDATKDLLFMNPFPHGIGNMTANNFLANGAGTAAKGLWYGLKGAPKGSVEALNAMKAGAYTPELLDEPSPWGPVGWMNALGKKGVPAAARGGVGAAAGGAIANKMAPDTDTPQQRALRTAEGSILGAVTGASPEVLNASNKVMSRLETGHRAAMLEGLPKGGPKPEELEAQRVLAQPEPVLPKPVKPRYTAAQAASLLRRGKVPEVHGPATINSDSYSISPYKPGRIRSFSPLGESSGAGSRQMATDILKGGSASPDTRGEQINAVFGGGEKSPAAKIATALGGPFAAWQADVVPRVVGSALRNAPARVEAFNRGQDITNRDVLKDQPYKLQTGGPVGGFSEMLFNTPKYASRLLGPLGGIDPNETTNPKTFSLQDKLKDAAYDATPGRDVVGPFFGDAKYKSKAPAIPAAALSTALGWHFSNKTPSTDAILQIMRSTGLDQQAAARMYERFKR